jgi:hypothetical protein
LNRSTPGAFGFLTLSQAMLGPDRRADSRRFDDVRPPSGRHAVAGQDDVNERGEHGGFVRPCSLDGVNPVHHINYNAPFPGLYCFSVCSGVAKLHRPAKYMFIAKIRTRKSLLAFGTSIRGGDGVCERPRSPLGVSGGYGDDDRDRTFLGERRYDSRPYCSAVARPPEMAALSLIVAGGGTALRHVALPPKPL